MIQKGLPVDTRVYLVESISVTAPYHFNSMVLNLMLNLSNRYVAEMMKNRVLRFFKKPGGHYHGSVFIQLSGGVGPSCLTLDAQGSLYIGQFETRGTQ